MISTLLSARFKLTIIIPRPRLKGFYFNSMVQGRDTGGIFCIIVIIIGTIVIIVIIREILKKN